MARYHARPMSTEPTPAPSASPTPGPVSTPAPAPTPAAAAPAGPPAQITIDDFLKVDLRVATILQAENHPKADKLFKLQIDLGTEQRQICAGIRGAYTAEQLVGRQIIVVANLAPRALRGEMSHGMLLAASVEAEGARQVVLLAPSSAIAAGAKVG